MRTAVDDLHLTTGHDEEFLLVFALLHEELAQSYLLCLERTGQAVHYLVLKL